MIESDGRRQRNGRDKESTKPEMQTEGGEIVQLKRPLQPRAKSSELSSGTEDPMRLYLRLRDRSSFYRATARSVGPGGRDESGKLIPIDVKVGDRILFGKWSGTEAKIDDVEYLIMKESDIMGVLAEAEAKKKAAECALQILVREGDREAGSFEGRENIGSIILIVGFAQQSFLEMRSNKKEF